MIDQSLHRLLVGDIHSDWDGAREMLETLGAVDANGDRLPGWWLVQLGDLIHGGREREQDQLCLEEGLRTFDQILLGNHELPHAFPANAHLPGFFGAHVPTPRTRMLLSDAVRSGKYLAATALDGWLLTHAGIHPLLHQNAGLPVDAETCALELNARFAQRIASANPRFIFDAVGEARGGDDPFGGIFWLDWRELCAVESLNNLPQIVGHSVHETPVQCGEKLWCVDVGAALSARVCALYKANAGDEWHPIVF